jgi:hypothetical protein
VHPPRCSCAAVSIAEEHSRRGGQNKFCFNVGAGGAVAGNQAVID